MSERYIRLTEEFYKIPLFSLSDRANAPKLMLLLYFIRRANWKDNGAYKRGTFQADYEDIANTLGTSTNTVGKWIKALVADGYLEKCKYKNARGRICNHQCRYRIVEYDRYTSGSESAESNTSGRYFG